MKNTNNNKKYNREIEKIAKDSKIDLYRDEMETEDYKLFCKFWDSVNKVLYKGDK